LIRSFVESLDTTLVHADLVLPLPLGVEFILLIRLSPEQPVALQPGRETLDLFTCPASILAIKSGFDGEGFRESFEVVEDGGRGEGVFCSKWGRDENRRVQDLRYMLRKGEGSEGGTREEDGGGIGTDLVELGSKLI